MGKHSPQHTVEQSTLRYELKLVAPAYLLAQLRARLEQHSEAFRVQYPPRQVNSLYFDTPQLGSYRANLLGNRRRHKLRLRWYDFTQTLVKAQLELKRKRNMVGDKKLFVLPEPLALQQNWRSLRNVLLAQTPPAWHIQLHEASEAIAVTRYWREYYISADKNIRVTFDYRQQFYDQRGYFRPNLQYKLSTPDQLVIEIKSDPCYTDRLENLAGEFPLRRSRNSKYVNSILAAIG